MSALKKEPAYTFNYWLNEFVQYHGPGDNRGQYWEMKTSSSIANKTLYVGVNHTDNSNNISFSRKKK